MPSSVRNKAVKMNKMDRGAVGSSMMSGNSSEDRDSIARRTNQSRTSGMAQANLFSSMDDSNQGSFAAMQVQKRDHRKYDKERPKPYLDFNDFLVAIGELIEGERPEIVDNLVEHLTGIQM